jgi:hypothetical protein
VFRGKQCEKATKCKACPEYSEGKNDEGNNDDEINAMLRYFASYHIQNAY